MKLRTTLTALGIAAAVAVGSFGLAFGEEKHTNLKVLADNGKKLESGMKKFSSGLGVKCNVCHEKGKFEADSVATKEDGRKFLTAVLDEKDQAKKDAALKTLLEALKLKEAKAPADVWEGIGMLEKKK